MYFTGTLKFKIICIVLIKWNLNYVAHKKDFEKEKDFEMRNFGVMEGSRKSISPIYF